MTSINSLIVYILTLSGAEAAETILGLHTQGAPAAPDGPGWVVSEEVDALFGHDPGEGKEGNQFSSFLPDGRLTAAAAAAILPIALERGQGIIPSRDDTGRLGWVEAISPSWDGQLGPSCYWRRGPGCWTYESCTGNTIALVTDQGELVAVRRDTHEEWVGPEAHRIPYVE